MPEKPSFAYEYRREQVELVRQTCVYVATKLGDLLEEFVVVGGLVPSLLIPEKSLPQDEDAHVGTMDLDLGLSLALLDAHRYEDLTSRLRRAGFEPDVNEGGNPTFQRWKIEPSPDLKVTVDFVIPPSLNEDKGGNLRHIERDFAAVITPGLQLAFKDKRRVSIRGDTIIGEKASRDVWVCGPGAFLVLKALAFDTRGENKDAYDLYYVIRNYGSGVDDIFGHLKPILDEQETRQALQILQRDFSDPNGVGPRRVAEFLYAVPNEELQADVVGFVRELLIRCGIS
ncbi:MAG: hypothetical protein JRF46_14765 [Deltaproteobacteria bacterium]|nr:hypothetical protein [Deltaproteobacteria bacterium]